MLATVNFWNVTSNLPFLLVGATGLWLLRSRNHHGMVDTLHTAYIIFFLGVFVTGFGSSWYHLAPDNDTLVWDRLPMTVAFMALFVIVIGEHVCEQSARRLLIPLLLTGTASVFYWQYTESIGSGDLRPYALVQFLPMILIPAILLLYPARFYSRQVFWGMIALYALSKVFEHFDHEIYNAGQLLSGHSIKHLVAAAVPAFFLHGIHHRYASTTAE